MMVSNRQSVFGVLAWQWQRALFFAASGGAALALHVGCSWTHLVLPAMPLGVVGGAIGIFTSFRTNSCYARWWEGRQLWGRLINNTRDLGSLAMASFPDDAGRAIVRRTIAHVHVLRCLLRDQDALADERVQAFTTEAERAALVGDRNMTYALLHAQRVALTALADEGRITDQRYLAFDRLLAGLLDVQGGCERIKRTPFPRGYNFIADRLVLLFGVLLPFAMVKDLGWVTVPMNVLVCMSFALISEAGRVLEDPFTLFWNGLPLSALSTTIELNLRQMSGEKDVPPLPKPDERGILM
jgi:ion channel-forming bestrophin family protein